MYERMYVCIFKYFHDHLSIHMLGLQCGEWLINYTSNVMNVHVHVEKFMTRKNHTLVGGLDYSKHIKIEFVYVFEYVLSNAHTLYFKFATWAVYLRSLSTISSQLNGGHVSRGGNFWRKLVSFAGKLNSLHEEAADVSAGQSLRNPFINIYQKECVWEIRFVESLPIIRETASTREVLES